MIDIFNDDAFGVVSLTDTINDAQFVPGYTRQLGLFQETGTSKLTVAIEKKGDVLVLIPPTPRGAPGTTLDKAKRNIRSLDIPHFEVNDAIYADEVQGVRKLGSEDEVETVLDKIAERNMEIRQSFEATHEYHRVGAMKGVVAYADGSELDLFDFFGISQDAEIAWDFANKKDGNVRAQCAKVYRTIATDLGAIPFTGVLALCSDTYFDALIKNAEVRETYLAQQEARELRQGYVGGGASGAFGMFTFGDITWVNYRGAVGGQAFIEADKAHFVPIGVPGLFRAVAGPADYIETVNTIGVPLYAKQYEMANGKGVHYDVQSNVVHYCTRPKVLKKGKLGA